MNAYPAIDQAIARFHFYSLASGTPKPSPDAVRRQAALAGIRLAESFVHFSAAHGAGAFADPVGVALPPGCPLGPRFAVDILFAAGAPEDRDALALREGTYAGRLPLEAVPVATDAEGNLLLVPPGEEAPVYAWDHEHRELGDGALDRIVADLRAAAVPVDDYDIDQLILIWEEAFPARVANASGHGNLYRVADSYLALFNLLRPA